MPGAHTNTEIAPGTGPGYMQPGATAGSGAPPAAPGTQGPFSPTYLSQLFPGGIPTSSPSTVSGIPSLDPTTVTNNILAGLQPGFAQQQQGLNEALASAGVMGGGGIGAENNLMLQQGLQSLSATAPYVMQGMEGNQNAALNAGEFNAGAQNNAQQFDINNLIHSAMFDIGTQSGAQNNLAGMQNADWLAQMNAMQSGYYGAANAFQGNYQQPAPSTGGYANLASGLSSLFPAAGGAASATGAMGIGATPQTADTAWYP